VTKEDRKWCGPKSEMRQVRSCPRLESDDCKNALSAQWSGVGGSEAAAAIVGRDNLPKAPETSLGYFDSCPSQSAVICGYRLAFVIAGSLLVSLPVSARM
jgi:hypothetical protein